MTITEYRKANGLTLEAFAGLFGKTKAHMSAIEQSGRCTARLALDIERETKGAVDAASLNDEIAEARRNVA